jgi:hypothetical protein
MQDRPSILRTVTGIAVAALISQPLAGCSGASSSLPPTGMQSVMNQQGLSSRDNPPVMPNPKVPVLNPDGLSAHNAGPRDPIVHGPVIPTAGPAGVSIGNGGPKDPRVGGPEPIRIPQQPAVKIGYGGPRVPRAHGQKPIRIVRASVKIGHSRAHDPKVHGPVRVPVDPPAGQ